LHVYGYVGWREHVRYLMMQYLIGKQLVACGLPRVKYALDDLDLLEFESDKVILLDGLTQQFRLRLLEDDLVFNLPPLLLDQQLFHELRHVHMKLLPKFELKHLRHLMNMLGQFLMISPKIAQPHFDRVDIHGQLDVILGVRLILNDAFVHYYFRFEQVHRGPAHDVSALFFVFLGILVNQSLCFRGQSLHIFVRLQHLLNILQECLKFIRLTLMYHCCQVLKQKTKIFVFNRSQLVMLDQRLHGGEQISSRKLTSLLSIHLIKLLDFN